jgi:putative ABC transport system permease protein
MWSDIFVAGRTLLKRPGYATSVVLTLAVGIGASTVMFSLLDAALLRPLPFADPGGLVFLTGVAGPQRTPRGGSFPEVTDWRTMNQTLQDVSIYDETSLNMRLGEETIRVETEMVSASYFPLLGVSPSVGRAFLPDEDAVPDRNHVAVISHALWRGRFGQTPDILQRTVQLNDQPFAIVGVMPEGFSGVSFDTDLWVPAATVSLTSAPSVMQDRGTRWLGALGRLNDGVTFDRAQDDLTRIAGLLERQYPDTNRDRGVQLATIDDALRGDTSRLLTALFGAVLLFLIVACANVATLQLARASARRRELAVRLALGARRWHVVRQLLSESLVLSCTAGIVGVLAAAWALGALLAMMPDQALPAYVHVALDPRAIVFAIGVSLVSGLLVAALPAVTALRADLSGAMKEGGRTAGPGLGSIRRPSVQQALVVAEIALALTLLTGAGLMVRSLDGQMRVRIGFQPEPVTVARVTLPTGRYLAADRAAFSERLLAQLQSMPLVEAATIATSLPFTGNTSASILVPDIGTGPESRERYYRHLVTPDFFRTLGIAMVRGRGFVATDRADAPPVAVINESAARRIWNTTDVVGRHIRIGNASTPPVEIVGVAADARFRDLTTDLSGARVEPDVYFPFAQRSDRDLEIAVRTTDGSALPLQALQAAVSAVDASLPAYRVQRLSDAVRQQTSSQRFASALLSMFSLGALLLSALGLYGLISYIVGLSRQEIAIRLALGASRYRVVALIVRNGLMLVGVGILMGSAGAFAAGRALQAQLFQTGAADLSAFAVVSGMLLGVTLVATLLPARRAARINPQTALRGD